MFRFRYLLLLLAPFLLIGTLWRTETAVSGGIFTDSGQMLGNGLSYDVAMGDVDGDLDLDVVVANYGNGVIGEANKVWLNQDGLPTATPTATPLTNLSAANRESVTR